ncbi:nitric oxide synthase oxygenase [Alkalibacillus almallahensis]|uniref:nitric oxide synthase oxygenase n=1 Tax=Alkalibacillus almallahensis TaxID=1379154 RepID=UPI001420D0E2|nr:nitric oxide synthase oxygenase [Alkalibacillus almallahensis]NIK11719.1 nitric-oxide synthase [Alkalibacillus almallahensis]
MGLMHQEAQEFLSLCYEELGKSENEMEQRIKDVFQEIDEKGFYEHHFEELEYGAKMAWRNSNRCIGRLFWDQLHVLDKRYLKTEEAIYQALIEHIDFATNGGKIRPTISVFSQSISGETVRIWNHQLIRYAGYETEDGIVGDPDSIAFTNACIDLEWEPKYGQFDILPLVIQVNDNEPKWFNIPEDLVYEVSISHPEYEWFSALNLKWYAVPIISDMSLDIGGILYSAAPFNGWYMGTEIGARNLADDSRYNMLPTIADYMNLNNDRPSTLWKDRALIELNTAVLYSFKQAGISIVDHHTAAQQFKKFEEKEAKADRDVTGKWSWLIPPVSPATTHVFHKPYRDAIEKPNYFYQSKPYSQG